MSIYEILSIIIAIASLLLSLKTRKDFSIIKQKINIVENVKQDVRGNKNTTVGGNLK